MVLDQYMNGCNNERTREGKRCQGRTLIEIFLDGMKYFVEKNFNERLWCKLTGNSGGIASINISSVQEIWVYP